MGGRGRNYNHRLLQARRVVRGVLESDVIHRGVQSGCSFEGCCVGSNTPWLQANSDANLILTSASASPCGSRRAAVRRNNQ